MRMRCCACERRLSFIPAFIVACAPHPTCVHSLCNLPIPPPQSITVRCLSSAAAPSLPAAPSGQLESAPALNHPKTLCLFRFLAPVFQSSNCGCTRPGTDDACPSSLLTVCVLLRRPSLFRSLGCTGGFGGPGRRTAAVRSPPAVSTTNAPLPPTSRNPCPSPPHLNRFCLRSAPDPCPPISLPL